MSDSERTVQLHIGANQVLEKHLGELAARFSRDERAALVSDDLFKRRFRDQINANDIAGLRDYVEEEFFSVQNVFISRPKFLFGGKPMNIGQSSAVYKIDSFQEAFASFRVVIHLCITDHLTYCIGNQKLLSGPLEAEHCSWMPLIEQLRGQLNPNNYMCVWNAENAELFKREISTFWAQQVGVEFLHSEGPDSNGEPPESELEKEEFAFAKGWDVDQLDSSFEHDLEYLEAGSPIATTGTRFSG